ncbi:MAG: serine hydrolase [Firmicutes bacterium]|nr:serine hydrolase [Bacillota bacterium]
MARTTDLDRLLETFLQEGLPGCGLKVAQNGKTLYEGYFGYGDVEKKVPVTDRSVFRIASMSKIVLYTTMMMLYERGKFLLTDPISRYLPQWKESRKLVMMPNGQLNTVPTERPINFSDVMSMKCGLPYCNGPALTEDRTLLSMQECMKPLWEKGHFTVQEQVEAMSQALLSFEPGTHWMYGFSSEIAAALVERITDMPVDDALRTYILDPLGMENTRSRFFGDIQERMVKLYSRDDDGKLTPVNSSLDDKHLPGAEHEMGWGRLFSTVDDYSRLMQMLACGGVFDGHRLMGRKTIDMMRSNGLSGVQLREFQNEVYNEGYGYGYGVRTLIDQGQGNHNGSLGAFGWSGFFGTWCEADPEEGLSVVYMHNCMSETDRFEHLRVRSVSYGLVE